MTSRLNRPACRSLLAHSSPSDGRSPLVHRWAFTATGCRWTVSTRRPLPEGLRRLISKRIDAFEGV